MNSGSYKPTLTQELIWLDQKISGNNQKYNVGGYVRLKGEVDHELLKGAIEEVMLAHDIFQTRFSDQNGSEFTAHLDGVVGGLRIEEQSYLEVEDGENAAISWMQMDFQRPLSLIENALFSNVILTVREKECFWYCKLHHIICDGWSFQLLLNHVASAYEQKLAGIPSMDAKLPYGSFAEFSQEDQAYISSQAFENDAAYWAKDFEKIPEPLFVKHDLDLRTTGEEGGSFTLDISAREKSSLEALAKANKVTLFQLMVGVFLIYLARTHAKREVTIALPILNRTNRKFRETVGPFMNLLPVKFQYKEDWSLMEVVQEVKHKLFGVMRHQRYQYGYLLNDLNPDRPDDIYHVRLSYESFRFSNQMGNASCSAHALANHQEVDPLAVYVRDYNEDGFDVKFVYRRNYLIDEAIAAMSQGVKMILEAIIKNNDTSSASVSLMDERTISRIHQVSHGPEIHWKAHTFSALWQQQLERFRVNPAIESPQGQWTYGQVDEEVKKYAQFLVGNEGVQREGMIALLLPQTEQTVFVMLAGLMSGVAYIPLEPDNPIERHVAFLKQIGCTQLLTSREVLNDDLNLDINWIEDVVRSEDNSFSYPDVIPDQLAYIMQTSGSTGNPKGVPVTNRAVANYIQYFQQYFRLSDQDTVVQAASLGFDTSVEEIFPILISGGKLQLLQHRRDLNELSDCLKNKGVTLLSASPLVLDYLSQMNESYPSLRTVISGGDKLQYGHVRAFLDAGIDVYNTYGPTEATVCATYAKLDPEVHNSSSIGNPIANAATYLLNEKHELLPEGVIGEIFIGGIGVSSGYLKNEKLNQQKFVAHPFRQDHRLYKSGDNGLRRHDGSIAFLGRNDNEVKIRGMRIDPDEIEGAVKAYPEVENAVAIPNADLTEMLCFYTLSNSDQEKTTEIRQFISKVLPPYMIPKNLILLDRMEINERGKVDRYKMRDQFVSVHEEEVLAPKTRHEERLLEIWKAVLGLEEISTQSSFFEIGGHSISANKMINRTNSVFGVELDLVDAFTYPTIGLLGAHIASKEQDSYDIIELC